jgi:hypothetical protein
MITDRRIAIRNAEEEIEDILERLERDHKVRAYRIYVNSSRGDTPQINIVLDKQGGSL